MKNFIKEQIKQVEQEMYRAVELENYSYAEYFDIVFLVLIYFIQLPMVIRPMVQ